VYNIKDGDIPWSPLSVASSSQREFKREVALRVGAVPLHLLSVASLARLTETQASRGRACFFEGGARSGPPLLIKFCEGWEETHWVVSKSF